MIRFENLIAKNADFIKLTANEINANAFLFESADNVLLENFALMFAKFLLCSSKNERPCGNCPSCKKIEASCHADLKVYPANSKNVVVEDIKNLAETVYLSPIEGEKKVFLFNHFSTATVQAQNKLLKILEEPPANVFIILCVENISKVLPTVASRCKKSRLSAISNEQISSELGHINQQKLQVVVANANGNLTKALQFAEDENFFEVYQNVLKAVVDLKDSKQLIMFSSKISANKENVALAFDIFEGVFRDLLLIKLNKKCFVQNADVLQNLECVAQQFDCDAIDNIIKKIIEQKTKLSYNCSGAMLVDNLLLYILEVKYLCNKKLM